MSKLYKLQFIPLRNYKKLLRYASNKKTSTNYSQLNFENELSSSYEQNTCHTQETSCSKNTRCENLKRNNLRSQSLPFANGKVLSKTNVFEDSNKTKSIAKRNAAFQNYGARKKTELFESAKFRQQTFHEGTESNANINEKTDIAVNSPKSLKESLLHKGIELTKDIEIYLDFVDKCVQDKESGIFQNSKLLQSLENMENIKDIKVLFAETIQLIYAKDLKKLSIEKSLQEKAKKVSSALQQDIESVLDIYLMKQDVKAAHSLVTSAYLAKKEKTLNFSDIDTHDKLRVYNKLMWAWAKQGNLHLLKTLFEQMRNLNILANLDTYAAVLACLGRQTNMQSDLTRRVLIDIDYEGLQLDDMFSDNNISYKDQEFIERAVRSAKPEYVSTRLKQKTNYKLELLEAVDRGENMWKNPFHGIISNKDLEQRTSDQMLFEEEDFKQVESIVPSVDTPKHVIKKQKIENYKERWKENIRIAFSQQKSIAQNKSSNNNLLPYLSIFPNQVYVDLVLQEVDHLVQFIAFSPQLSVMEYKLGLKLCNKYKIQKMKSMNEWEKMQKTYKDFVKAYNEPKLSKNHRNMWQDALEKNKFLESGNDNSQKWSYSTTRKIGAFLYNIILNDVKVQIPNSRLSIPAFYTIIRHRSDQQMQEIKAHPLLLKMYTDEINQKLKFDPLELPSLSPPVPWCNSHYGADVAQKTEFLKNSYKTTKSLTLLQNTPKEQLYPIFDAINTVSMTPWIINKPVLDIVIDLFNSGGDSSLDIPAHESSLPAAPSFHMNMTNDEKYEVIVARNKHVKEKHELMGLWYTELYRLSIANMYRDKIFWFSHNIDFRGRIYPNPPHFNHIGNDLARSLMKFAKGKPLGPDGLNWLKIHLVNLSGAKKRSSNEERLEFANSIMEKIYDSADKPFSGEEWWKSCDEPWQALACCKEIAQASRLDNPEQYICHFPVHQDGSCNGLQHYAALGRDQGGAESVNLAPFERPNDVYSDVVELIEEERKADAKNGLNIAKVLEGHIKRKVVKQTIMTTVYGVTYFGAVRQITGQLEELKDLPEEHLDEASRYIARKTFYCLQKMFTSTKQIQDWFVICAELLSLLHQPVDWVTPLGLPVVQPYFRESRVHTTRSTANKTRSRANTSVIIEKPNAKKQQNGFPPNFIHSLDATHMMLTAIYCLKAGITFVSVHDCYWTHPCDVAIMNKICREQFVALHQQPILENLAENLLAKYGFDLSQISDEEEKVTQAKKFVNAIFTKVPKRGSFDINTVLDSTYFFS